MRRVRRQITSFILVVMETVARAEGLWELDFEFPQAAGARLRFRQKGKVPEAKYL